MTSNWIVTAGWFFFAAWSAVLATLAAIAFGPDVLPFKVPVDLAQKTSSQDSATYSRNR